MMAMRIQLKTIEQLKTGEDNDVKLSIMSPTSQSQF